MRMHKSELELRMRLAQEILDTSKALEPLCAQFLSPLEEPSSSTLANEYKSLIDSDFIVSKTDPEGIITYVNDAFTHVSKYSKEELLGKKHNIIKDPSNPQELYEEMWQTITAKKRWKGSFSNRAKDGSIYYVDAIIKPIVNDKNEIVEYIAIRKDITKEVEAKKEIEEQKRFIQTIFDNQDNIVIYTSKEEGMLAVNKKLFEYLDFENFEDFKSKHKCICDLFIKKEGYIDPHTYPDWLDMAADADNSFKALIKTKDEVVRTFSFKVKRFEKNYLINLNDITDLENALLKAYESEQAKSIFLANMSHEIRTPLNGIIGFTDLLLKKEMPNEIRRYIEIISRSGKSLLHIVNDILDFSKLQEQKMELDLQEADLLEEMEATVYTLASVAKNKHIDYFTYIDPHLPRTVLCDVHKLKQVMTNLIGNAIKFTPEGGKVEVAIRRESIDGNKAVIHFSVKDSGIGIEKEKLKTIFQPFSQADNRTAREFGGTGLGLAISSRFIEMMGSSIKVSSTPKEGSCFEFDLSCDILNKEDALSVPKSTPLHIAMLIEKREEKAVCDIYSVVSKYLDAWGMHYDSIDSLEALKEESDLLIICEDIFDQKECRQLLETRTNLHILFIEGQEDNGPICEHNRFTLITQPVTGSLLFNAIAPHLHHSSKTDEHSSAHDEHFEGRVLVAEDNETNQILISAMLEERSVAHTIVQNGKEAVERALREDFDLILMDVNMPVMDGLEAIGRLRLAGYVKPIVTLSADVIQSDIERFKTAGADDTLPKPLEAPLLDAVLRKYLKTKEHDTTVRDTIDIKTLKSKLQLPDDAIIYKLLESFASSLQNTLDRLEKEDLNKDLLHNLKGIFGNLRLQNGYEFIKQCEENSQTCQKESLTAMLRNYLTEVQSTLQKES